MIEYDASEITDELSQKDAIYAANKKTGGDAGPDGYHFEIVFAVDQVLGMAESVLRHHTDPTAFRIEKQPHGFVDDLATHDGIIEKRFECKAGSKVSWGTGPRSIASNFQREAKMFARKRTHGRFLLVVSSPSLRDELTRSPLRPDFANVIAFADADISGYVDPFSGYAWRLWRLIAPSFDGLSFATASRHLVGAVTAANGQVTLPDLLQEASRQSHFQLNDLSRLDQTCKSMEARILDACASIPAERGFSLAWRTGILVVDVPWLSTRLTVPLDPHTSEFEGLVAELEQLKPSEAHELIETLWRHICPSTALT